MAKSSDAGPTLRAENQELISQLPELERECGEPAPTLSQKRLDLALEAAGMGTWEIDSQSGLVTASAATCAIFGFDSAPPRIEDWAARLHPEDRERVRADVQRAMVTGSRQAAECRIVWPDGNTRWVSAKAAPVADDAGRFILLAGVVEDITDRKRSEADLRTLAQLSEQNPNPVLRITPGRGLDYANRAAWEWLTAVGATQGRPLPLALEVLVERAAREGCAVDAVLAGEDGRIFWLTAAQPAGEVYVNVYGRDITERKRAQVALRESEERLRLAQSAANIGIWEWHLGSGQLDWTPELERIYGYEPDTFPGSYAGFRDRVHPDDLVEAERLRDDAVKAHQPFDCDFRVCLPSSEVRWVNSKGSAIYDADGKPQRVFGVNVDITERKRAEERLRESEERFRLAQDAAGIGSFEWNSRTGMNIWTPKLEQMYGLPVGAFGGTRSAWENLVHPEDRAGAAELVRKTFETGQPVEGEWRVIWPDGSVRWLAGRFQGFRNDDGATQRVVGVNIDMTERKHAEERLRHAQKLESIGVLAGGIAHDFNNLLTSIMGNASLLQLGARPEEAGRFQKIMEASERAAGLTRQLLAYAGKGQFQIVDFDVRRMVHSTADLIRVSVPKSIDVELDLPGDMPMVRGDSSQIQQVLMNLVINAAEATQGRTDGRVSILAEAKTVNVVSAGRIGWGIAPGRYIVLAVQDNGCGMDEQTISQIFDPFFTTKFTGRGLGLAAVHGILRSHKGTITVESKSGQGSTFTVYLPCSEAEATTGPARAPNARRLGTVLVVDDEESVRGFTKAALERLGHRVLLANNGQEALEALGNHDEIDLVVLDIVMPVKGGVEAFSEMQHSRPGVAVLVASGHSRWQVLDLGIPEDLPYIQKPYTIQMLGAAVETALEARAHAGG